MKVESTDFDYKIYRFNAKVYFIRAPAFAGTFALLVWVIYFLTLCPTVFSGDSGELITNAYRMGVAHPSGYPLFLFFGKAFTYVPWGSIAWRVNLLSATGSALATFFLVLTFWVLEESLIAGIFAGAIYAFSPLIWHYSVTAEVFALNQLLISVVIFILVKYLKNPQYRTALLGSFVMGLGMSNHQSFLFIGFPLFVWLLFKEARLHRKHYEIFIFFSVGALGLVPYCALPLLNPQASIISWGDLTTIRGFFHHILRSDYGTLHLAAKFDPGNFWSATAAYFLQLFPELLWIGPILAIFGNYCGILKKQTRSLTLVLTLSVFAYVLIFHFLAGFPLSDKIYAGTLKKFWLMPNLIFVIFSSMGVAAVLRKFERNSRLYSLAGSAIIFLCLAHARIHFRQSDQSQNRLYHEFGERLLAPLEPNSLLVTYGDLDFFIAAYMLECEGLRQDVKLVSEVRLQFPWYQELIKGKYPQIQLLTGLSLNNSQNLYTFLYLNSNGGPLYLASRDPSDSGEWQTKFNAWPVGFADRLLMKDQTPDIANYLAASSKAWGDMDWMKLASEFPDEWEGHIIHRYWWSEYNRAMILSQHDISKDHLSLTAAASILTNLNIAFPNNAEIQNQLGTVKRRLSQTAD